MTAEELLRSLSSNTEKDSTKEPAEIITTKKRVSEETVTEIIKSKLSYDDVMGWVKQYLRPEYDGVYLCRKRAGLFEKGEYKIYVCFSINKELQSDSTDPSVIFVYDELDERLKNMMGNKELITINLKIK